MYFMKLAVKHISWQQNRTMEMW